MSDLEETKIALKQRLREDLLEVLANAQKYSHPASLCNTNPERWLEWAGDLAQGRSRTSIYKNEPGSLAAIKTVEAQMMADPRMADLKKEFEVLSIQSLQTNHEISTAIDEAILRRSGEFETMPMKELGTLGRDMAVKGKLTGDMLLRLRGDNVQKIEVTHKKESWEDMMAAVEEAAAKMKPADVIDIGEDESDDG